jgi:monofunctional biosynthetic peptidoglycan transglycosylase
MKMVRGSLTPIAIIVLLAVASVALGSGQATIKKRTLFTFDSPNSAGLWLSINDTVMGGVSSGACRVTEAGTLEFSGEVSLENNGGFASVRAGTGSLDLSAYDELVVRVRGDGQRYALSVQTDHWIMAGAYYFDLQTRAGQWQEIRAPMRAFEARSFGRPFRGAPPLNARDIRALGFIISDKQAGPFRFEVDWIKAAKSREGKAPHGKPAEREKPQMAAALIQKAIGHGVPLFNAGQPEACAAIYEIAAHCIVDLSAADLPADFVETLRTGLAKAERTADPAARAWALRNAFDVGLRILAQDRREKEVSND